jgi:hypothetical protein
MAIVTDSLFDRHSQRIQEIINKSIDFLLAKVDPVWEDVIKTSIGVGSPNEMGRDLKVIKVFLGSMTGVIEQGDPYKDFDLYGDATTYFGDQMHLQSLVQTYPDPTEGANATPYRLSVGMRSMPANIMMTLGEKTAEATPALIGQVIGPKLMGFARNMAHTVANYWYLSQNDNYILCSVSNVTSPAQIGATGVWRFTFEPDNLASARFARGQRIDFYDTNGDRVNDDQALVANQDRSTRRKCFVESVSHLRNVVTVVADGDPAVIWNQDVVNTDTVTYANSKGSTGTNTFTGIAGVNSWLKPGAGTPGTDDNNNVLLGTAEADATDRINVDDHPEFASFQKAVNGVLTEHKLRQYLQRVHQAWDPYGKSIDCLIASGGVWLAYEAQKIGMERLDRTGRLSTMNNEGSERGFTFTYDGRSYMGYTSTCVESQTLYGIKKGGGNWKKYVPPSPGGTSRFRELDAYVPFEFVAGAITGTASNQLPIFNTPSGGGNSLVTEGSQMPGRIRMQMIPEQPNGMKLTGLTEDRVYGDVL